MKPHSHDPASVRHQEPAQGTAGSPRALPGDPASLSTAAARLVPATGTMNARLRSDFAGSLRFGPDSLPDDGFWRDDRYGRTGDYAGCRGTDAGAPVSIRSEEHTSELQ